jgi:hypothetical protein
MNEGVFFPIVVAMLIVATLMTVMFGDGWVWVPILGAILLGGAAAKALG